MPDIFSLLLIISLIIMANFVARLKEPRQHRLFYRLLIGFTLPILIVGMLYIFTPADQVTRLQSFTGLQLENSVSFGIVMLLMAIWGVLVTNRPLREAISRTIPLNPDSPVHALALFLAGFVIGNVAFVLTQGGIAQLAQTASTPLQGQAVSTSILETIWPQLLFILLAVLGVGWPMRRNWRMLAQRLGLEKPTKSQLLMGLRWIAGLVVLQWIIGALWLLTDPVQAEQLGELNDLLLGNVDTVWEWVVLAAASGVGEELLFRGAIQPIFGVSLTAVLFALGHVQYGFTPITLLILIIGLALGHIRKKTNTTTAIFVHAGYNFVLGMVSLLVETAV